MSKKKEVVFYTDGRHTSVYIYEPPMDRRIYTAPVDELVDLGIDTILYAVGDCRVLLYDTKVGERWGHNVNQANHLIWYRAGLNLEQAIAAGFDPLALVCERAQDLGFSFLPSFILGMQHQPPAVATDCRCSDFCFEHPEYQVGAEPDFPEAQWDDPTRFSYTIEAVRQNRLAVIEELVDAYPTDGIELNLADYAPFLARKEIPEHTATFTEFIRAVRRICDTAATRQGRPKRLLVRAGASLAGCKSMGIDLETLIKEEIVDTVLAMPPHQRGYMEQDPSGIAQVVEAARGTTVQVITGISTQVVQDAYSAAPRPMQVVQATNGYSVGSDGVFFHTYYPSGYPYTDADYGTIRGMGRPELLAHKDKHYAVRQGPNGPDDSPGGYGLPNPLPVELAVGQLGVEQQLYISDDIKAKAAIGELAHCELRLRLMALTHVDSFALWFNGQEIERESQEWHDMTYSVRSVPGNERLTLFYWITVDLSRYQYLPEIGKNTVRVDLLERDPRCAVPVILRDVEILVQYRDHRHAPRRDEWWR